VARASSTPLPSPPAYSHHSHALARLFEDMPLEGVRRHGVDENHLGKKGPSM
jgi:hypothetical protein